MMEFVDPDMSNDISKQEWVDFLRASVRPLPPLLCAPSLSPSLFRSSSSPLPFYLPCHRPPFLVSLVIFLSSSSSSESLGATGRGPREGRVEGVQGRARDPEEAQVRARALGDGRAARRRERRSYRATHGPRDDAGGQPSPAQPNPPTRPPWDPLQPSTYATDPPTRLTF